MTTTRRSDDPGADRRTAPAGADAELKAKHRAMWALGDYPASPAT